MSEKRLAVVTGAARGIGRGIVLELLKQGRVVAGLDIIADQLTELETIVKEAGFSVITKCVDITDTPKVIETEMTKKLPQPVIEAAKQMIPLRRVGTVDDVAKAVAFFASVYAAYITGHVLPVDGGMAM